MTAETRTRPWSSDSDFGHLCDGHCEPHRKEDCKDIRGWSITKESNPTSEQSTVQVPRRARDNEDRGYHEYDGDYDGKDEKQPILVEH